VQLHPANPGPGQVYGSAVKFSFSGSDAASGISKIEYRVGGGQFIEYGGGQVTVTENGNYLVEYRATDTAGNVGATQSVTFSIQEGTVVPDPVMPMPVLPMDPPAPIQFAINSPDVEAIEYSIEYSRDGGSTWEQTLGWTAYTGPFQLNDPGRYRIYYRWQDGDGNWSSVKTLPVTVKGTPGPVTTLSLKASPTSKKVKAGKKFNVKIAVANIGNGVAGDVKVCASAPAKKLKINGSKCQNFVPLGVGTSASTTFKLTKTKKGKSATATFKVTTPDAQTKTVKVKVKLKK